MKGEARLGNAPEAAATTIPQDGTTPLGAAARAGKLPAVKLLLRHGVDIELKGFVRAGRRVVRLAAPIACGTAPEPTLRQPPWFVSV